MRHGPISLCSPTRCSPTRHEPHTAFDRSPLWTACAAQVPRPGRLRREPGRPPLGRAAQDDALLAEVHLPDRPGRAHDRRRRQGLLQDGRVLLHDRHAQRRLAPVATLQTTPSWPTAGSSVPPATPPRVNLLLNHKTCSLRTHTLTACTQTRHQGHPRGDSPSFNHSCHCSSPPHRFKPPHRSLPVTPWCSAFSHNLLLCFALFLASLIARMRLGVSEALTAHPSLHPKYLF